MASLLRQLVAGLRILLVLTVVLGVGYPLAITAVAQVAAPDRANGSRVQDRAGRTVGSSLIGQPSDGPTWFHPRPSAAGEEGYDALASAPSNLGPANEELVALIAERRAAYAQENGPPAGAAIPADAVTASASGLDPHISPENARLQVARVARARGLEPARVQRLVREATQGRTLGVLGEARVNVLALNLALERLAEEAGAVPPGAGPSE